MPGQYVQLKFEDINSVEYLIYKQCDSSAKTHQIDICKHLRHPRLVHAVFEVKMDHCSCTPVPQMNAN